MSVQEKQAWFILAVLGLTALVYGALGLAVGFHTWTLGTLGLLGFVGVAPLIGLRERGRGKIIYDERDLLIARRAGNAAFGILWLAFVAGMMAPFFLKGPEATITVPVTGLALAVCGATVLLFTVQSLAVVIQYRTGRHGG
jgi:Predicted membrane protein (DUF2178).